MTDGSARQKNEKKQRPFWIELPVLLLVAVLVALVVRTFLLQTYWIPSGSMEQTLRPQDRVIVNKLLYVLRSPQRGEVIVFAPPTAWHSDKDDLIKRVIAIGGDRITCCDDSGRLTINGRALDERYLYPGDRPSLRPFTVTVPADRVFVLGDHRSDSADSRFHLDADQGTVPTSLVRGRAFARFWPLDRMGSLGVPAAFDVVPHR